MQADSKKWWVLVTMTGSLGMIMLDQTIVAVALPRMQADLHMTAGGLQWVVNAYILALAAMVATGGKLGDIWGRYRAFQTGLLLFCGASACSGMAQSSHMILTARAVQGIGAAIMQPASASIVINAFDLRERGRAMAVYSGIAMAFMAIGPLLGGIFTEYFTWRLSFWINIPIALSVFVISHFVALKDIKPEQHDPFDITGLILLQTGLVPAVLALQQGHVWGWSSPLTLSCLIGGFIFLTGFILYEKRKTTPLIQLKLFQSRPLTANTFILFCVSFAMIAQMIFSAIYMQNILGFNPFQAGLALLPIILAVAVMAQIMGRVFDRFGAKWPICTGTLLVSIGFFFQAAVLLQRSYLLLVPGMMLLGMGIGSTISVAVTDAMNRAPAVYRGQASGLIQTFRQMGGTIGLAIAGGVVSTMLHYSFTHYGKVSLSVEQQHTLGRMLSYPEAQRDQIAAKIYAADPQQLVTFVETSFIKSFTAAYILSAMIALLAFITALAFLQRGVQKGEIESVDAVF